LKLPLKQEQAAIDGWYQHWVNQCFAGLEQQALRYSRDGRHLYGDSVTLADVCLAPQMYNARRFKCDVAAFPTLVTIATALDVLPAFKAAVPEQQADAET
jgi:glutathione S-transferase